jgi:hypothetical protein
VISTVRYSPPRAPEPLIVFCSVSRVKNAVVESCFATTSFGSVMDCTIIEIADLPQAVATFLQNESYVNAWSATACLPVG